MIPHADDRERPIFVVGTPRSGTTLMARILGRHSRLFMPGETHFFDDVYAFRNTVGSLDSQQAREWVTSRLADHYKRYWELKDQERIDRIMRERPERWARWREHMRSYEGCLSGFMAMQMELEGKVRWGNNAPRDIFNVNEIRALYPRAKFVVCVRDPRDFLVSYRSNWKVVGGGNDERLRKLYHPVITSLLWKSSMRQLSRLDAIVPDVDRVVVRYEDLVSSSKATVERVCEAVDERFEAQMLDVEESNSSTGLQQKGIFASSVERWRRELDATDIVVAQRLVGREMEQLQYVRQELCAPWYAVAGCYLGAPGAFLRALRANAAMRGPLIPYLTRRVKTLLSG